MRWTASRAVAWRLPREIDVTTEVTAGHGRLKRRRVPSMAHAEEDWSFSSHPPSQEEPSPLASIPGTHGGALSEVFFGLGG
jgi:hypothetical protein